jgi:peptide/nickel transport system permease protein
MWTLAVVVLIAVVGALFTPDPNAQNLMRALEPPLQSLAHPLGTDTLGRDVLALLLHGLRVSLLVGVSAALISALVGVPIGLLAGYAGGRLEVWTMRAVDVGLSLPGTLVALVVIALWGAGLERLIVVLGITGWASFARLSRAVALKERTLEHVVAARALGATTREILVRHILPGVAGALLVKFTLEIPANMLGEAALSFLGLGAGVDTPSLGSSIAAGYARLYSGEWWLSLLPGTALSALVLLVNNLGDALRAARDPRALWTVRE